MQIVIVHYILCGKPQVYGASAVNELAGPDRQTLEALTQEAGYQLTVVESDLLQDVVACLQEDIGTRNKESDKEEQDNG